MSDQHQVQAGWYDDPMRRHQQRYWDGASWTEHVADGGAQSTDPVAGAIADPQAGAPADSRAQATPSGITPTAAGKPAGRVWRSVVGAMVATVAIYLLLVGLSVFAVVPVVVDRFVGPLEQKAGISIFLHDDAATADVDELQRQLVDDSKVSSIAFTSKEEALVEFKKTLDPDTVAQLDGNPLPASLDIELKDPNDVPAMVEQIKANPLLVKVADQPNEPEESLRYGGQVASRLFSVTRVSRLISVVLIIVALVLGGIAGLLMFLPPAPASALKATVIALVVSIALFGVTAVVVYLGFLQAFATLREEALFLPL